MRTVAVVQARTGSSRLPGKVLAQVGDRPMLGLMLARLQLLDVEGLVVATSSEERDDAVADVAAACGVAVVRGSESDVLGRFVAALDAHPADAVVRLTADCPLADPAVVRQAVDLHRASNAAYTSNTLVRTYPDGLDVEVLSAEALRAADAEATDPPEREHVTPFVYRRPERFPLRALRGPQLLGDERWTVDTEADLARIREIVAGLRDPVRAGWGEILGVAGRRPRVASDGVVLRPAGRDDDERFSGSGPPHAPFSQFLADPSVRSWVAEEAGRAIGWAQVSVRSAVGRLRRWSEPGHDDAVVSLVRRALADDYQVRELVTDG